MSWVATAVAGGAVASSVIGGVMGQNASAANRQAAEDAMKRAMAQYDGINIPDSEKQKLALQDPQVQGILQPYMQKNIEQGKSALGDIATDPRLATAQMNALDTMSKMGQTGLTAADTQALNAARRQTAGDAEARQKSITQQLAARGAGGGGLELAAKLAASQASADQAGQESDRTMSMAQQRMLQATAQAGQLGGQLRSQEYGEKANAANANDTIAARNIAAFNSANSANVQAANQAQAANLANKQRISEQQTALANQQQQYNTGLLQQQYGNQMALAGARAGSNVNYGNYMANQGNSIAQGYANMGSGVAQGIAGAGQMYNSNANAQANRDAYLAANGKGPVAPGQNSAFANDNQYNATGANAPEGTFAHGGVVESCYKDGGAVPGVANVPGDDEKNDTVHAKLSPGEIVIPRSHTISKDLAKAYIDHLYKVSKGDA